MPDYRIPFNKQFLAGDELRYVADAVNRGHISGDGYYTKKSHAILEEYLGAAKVLLTTSCTHALEMAALLLDLKQGDEVILPSFTFVSTANAFVMRGAKPVFADIRPDTFNIDVSHVASLMTARTRAVIPVHYAGVGCDMENLLPLARERGVAVVEDNAHGLYGRYKGKPLGSFGCLATQSFHETKNISCGEGGALVVNDQRYVERAEILREKGTNRSQFFRGQVDKYTWVDIGSSYLPSDILAAFLLSQLERSAETQRRRQGIWTYYRERFADWAEVHGVRLPCVPPGSEQAYHMFYLLLPSLADRQALIAHLEERGILSVFHYVPLHLSPVGVRLGGRKGSCPVTEDISDRILRLPFYSGLTEPEQGEVVSAVKSYVFTA